MDAEKAKEPLDDVYGEDYLVRLRETILDAARRCRNCNFCYPVCPLFESTRQFMTQAPSGLMQSLRYAVKWDLFTGDDREALRDLLYLCTTCNSCTIRCKAKSAGVPVLDAIKAGRKILTEMAIGPLPAQRKALKDIYLYGNPYGERPEKRRDWQKGLKVKLIPQDRADILLYVGCTTSYEPALHAIARALLMLLQSLHCDVGILGDEVCCGEPARRVGDEGLFQEMMTRNRQQWEGTGIKTLVTISPHCFNTFQNEYGPLPQGLQVRHYTQFLAEAFSREKPAFKKALPAVVTFHDPCYLGKHNQLYEAPRTLLRMVPGIELVEMAKNREDSLCCGGGGGRMYAEVEEERRLAELRVAQARAAGARIIATACPWCLTMLKNAVQDLGLDEQLQVRDCADILAEAITGEA